MPSLPSADFVCHNTVQLTRKLCFRWNEGLCNSLNPCNTLTELDIISMCFIAINYGIACFIANIIIIIIIVSLLLIKTLKLSQFSLKD